MTSQHRHNYNFQASQAVHGADDITIPHVYSQVNSLCICAYVVSKSKLLFTTEGWSAEPYSINFD